MLFLRDETKVPMGICMSLDKSTVPALPKCLTINSIPSTVLQTPPILAFIT